MKEKLAPHIKRLKNNIFLINGAYLMVDFRPMVTYLHQLLSTKVNRLLDEPIKILIIENHSTTDLDKRLENIPLKEISVISSRVMNLPSVIHLFKEDYYDFIIITHEDHLGFTNDDLIPLLKKMTCPIFIANTNEALAKKLI